MEDLLTVLLAETSHCFRTKHTSLSDEHEKKPEQNHLAGISSEDRQRDGQRETKDGMWKAKWVGATQYSHCLKGMDIEGKRNNRHNRKKMDSNFDTDFICFRVTTGGVMMAMSLSGVMAQPIG